MDWYLKVLKDYAGFSGRARRKEYWMFALCHWVILFVLVVLAGVTGMDMLFAVPVLYVLATLIPAFAVSIRRLHDTGRSGWWVLIGLVPIVGPIVLLVFTVQDSQPGPNEYGPNPKQLVA